ncbi:hypothetical protein SAMN05216598_5071 [Pseudomonas asplenii]|uniref:Uncharacterized protein n=1 Tax=Pseudomonas asplenii TaxID=53407 RepID=A0A1H1ZHB8_9PSED|nr:hypothetical protein SAMN05216598_5071 [Pseudomonas asplenii]
MIYSVNIFRRCLNKIILCFRQPREHKWFLQVVKKTFILHLTKKINLKQQMLPNSP